MHIALQDSIAGAETKKSILELEHKYEKERSARQIAVLQQNNLSEKAKYRFYTIIFLIVVIILLSAGFNILMRHRKAVEKAALANQENLILKQNMETKSRELVTNALQLAQMNEQFIQVNKQLKSIKSGLNDNQMTEINAAIGNIENNTFAKSWKEFETRYQQVHEGFYGNLQNACPTLTPAEIKICSFLRLNLTTKDIALLTNRTVGTIDNARSSIRKKLNLANDSNLTSFLLSL
jgi:DNA-binding CsgD family transcriptional regulator